MRKWRWVSSLLVVLVLVATLGISPADASPTVTRAQLKNGPVPSLCLHPAGQLHDGALLTEAEEIASGTGNVWYITSALGKVSPKIKQGAAAIVRCYAGGVPWPDNIVLYAPGPKIAGTIDLGEVFADQADEVRPVARSIKVSKGVTTVEVAGIAQGHQSPDFGTATATIKIGWRTDRFVVVSRVIRNHVYAAKRLLRALHTGKVTRVKALLGSKSQATSALRWYRGLGKDKQFYSCDDYSDYSSEAYHWTCWVGASGYGYLWVDYNDAKRKYEVTAWGVQGT